MEPLGSSGKEMSMEDPVEVMYARVNDLLALNPVSELQRIFNTVFNNLQEKRKTNDDWVESVECDKFIWLHHRIKNSLSGLRSLREIEDEYDIKVISV
jgi:hypothetical protein